MYTPTSRPIRTHYSLLYFWQIDSLFIYGFLNLDHIAQTHMRVLEEPTRYALERAVDMHRQRKPHLMALLLHVIPAGMGCGRNGELRSSRDLRSFAVNIEILYPYLFGSELARAGEEIESMNLVRPSAEITFMIKKSCGPKDGKAESKKKNKKK